MGKLLAVFLAGMSMAGCGGLIPGVNSCTEIGCQDTLTISVAPKSQDALPGGRYVMEIFDGTRRLRAEVLRNAGETQHFVGEEWWLEGTIGDHGIELRVIAAPASLEVSVTRDAQTVASGTLQPSYGSVRPNGADCPPICQKASASLTME